MDNKEYTNAWTNHKMLGGKSPRCPGMYKEWNMQNYYAN